MINEILCINLINSSLKLRFYRNAFNFLIYTFKQNQLKFI
jgi:hypothetical protein